MLSGFKRIFFVIKLNLFIFYNTDSIFKHLIIYIINILEY